MKIVKSVSIYCIYLLAPIYGASQTIFHRSQPHAEFFIDAGPQISTSGGLMMEMACDYATASNFGFGAAVGAIQHKFSYSQGSAQHGSSTDMAALLLADFRYYFNYADGSLIPFFQVGYNFYNLDMPGSFGVDYKVKGGTAWSLGMGYCFRLFKGGGGIFVGGKISVTQFTDKSISSTHTTSNAHPENDFDAMIGFRFPSKTKH